MILLHDFDSDFVAVILSQSEGLGKNGSGDSKNIFRIALLHQSMFFAVSLFAVSCHGPNLWSFEKLEIFLDCNESLFLFLKLYALVLKVKDTNLVLVCNHKNENWKAIYMLSSSTEYSLSMFLRIKSN